MRGRRRDGAAAGSEAQGRPASAVPPCPICHFHRHSVRTHTSSGFTRRELGHSRCVARSRPIPPTPPAGAGRLGGHTSSLQACHQAERPCKVAIVPMKATRENLSGSPPSGSRLRKIQDATRNQVTPFRVFGPHLGVQRAATCPAAARGVQSRKFYHAR